MKNIVILGAGTAGTMMLNKLSKVLDSKEWMLTIVDQEETHYYQPGFLFIPFGTYGKKDVVKPKKAFLPKGAEFIIEHIDRIVAEDNEVLLESGKVLPYDYLIVATGTEIRPDEIEGMQGD